MKYLVFILPLFFFGIIPATPIRRTSVNLKREISQCVKACEETASKMENEALAFEELDPKTRNAIKKTFNAKTMKNACFSHCATYIRR
ncbi:unnamed protein product [Cylicocyclus nassatus]|uniref:Uncharacterized protein n=1 Tax=Cylicocyclus nassatus TaxID=53992 RepID=A0AA36DI86_CYLNA|nr:unnamed protein product [Cylicocyclus nassatus]